MKNDPNAPIRLYNLRQDIGEKKNIADKHPDVVKQIAPLFKEAHTPSERFPLFAKKKNSALPSAWYSLSGDALRPGQAAKDAVLFEQFIERPLLNGLATGQDDDAIHRAQRG